MDQPSRIDLLELDIDLRLSDLWREAADVTEWNLEVVSAFMRAAYGKGYCDAFTEDDPGSLCHDHGYRIPVRHLLHAGRLSSPQLALLNPVAAEGLDLARLLPLGTRPPAGRVDCCGTSWAGAGAPSRDRSLADGYRLSEYCEALITSSQALSGARLRAGPVGEASQVP